MRARDTLRATGHEESSPGGDHRDRHVRGAGPRAHVHPALRATSAARTRPRPRCRSHCSASASARLSACASHAGPSRAEQLRARRVAVLPGRRRRLRGRPCRDSWRCRWCRSRSQACWFRTRMPRAAARPHARPMPIDLFAAASGCLVAPRLLGPLAPTEIMMVLGLICCGLALMLVERRARTVAAIALIAVAHVSLLVAGRRDTCPTGRFRFCSDPIRIPRRRLSKQDVVARRARFCLESARSPRRAPNARRTRPTRRVHRWHEPHLYGGRGASEGGLVREYVGPSHVVALSRSPPRPRARARRGRRCQRMAGQEVRSVPRRRGGGQSRDTRPAGALAALRRRRVPPAGRSPVHRGRSPTPGRHRRTLRPHRARVGADRKRPRAAVGDGGPLVHGRGGPSCICVA